MYEKDSERLIFLDDIHKEMEREISKICEKQMKIYCSRFGFTREDLLLWLEASRCDLVISFKGAKMMSIEEKKEKKL